MQRSPKHELQTLCSFLGQNIILGQCYLDKKRIAANNSRCSLRWGSYPFCRVLTLETLSKGCPTLQIKQFSLTLFGPAYFGVSGIRRGAHCAPLNIFGLGGVRVQFFFENDLPRNDLPYTKGFMKF